MDNNNNNPPDTLDSKSVNFKCANCGGDQVFDASSGLLRCSSCGTETSLEKSGGRESIVEYDLLEGLAKAPERGLGLPTKSVSCQSCGAIISFGATETAGACTFCASAQVLELDSHRQTLRPESLVPFAKTKNAANENFKSWIHSLWFRPNDLKKLASVSQIQGVYIPYWVFDATVDSRWRAMAGYYYYVQETRMVNENGRTVQKSVSVRKTRWVPASGNRTDIFDDFLICASKGLPKSLSDKLDTFSTKSLVHYDPSYLAGWKAEEYQIDLKPAWAESIRRMESIQFSRCSGDVPGDTQMGLKVQSEFHDTRFKHVLLPIWIAAYRYKDKSFQFLVNGQTGEVEGNAPYSWVKITFAVLFGLLVAAVIAMVVLSQQSQQYRY